MRLWICCFSCITRYFQHHLLSLKMFLILSLLLVTLVYKLSLIIQIWFRKVFCCYQCAIAKWGMQNEHFVTFFDRSHLRTLLIFFVCVGNLCHLSGHIDLLVVDTNFKKWKTILNTTGGINYLRPSFQKIKVEGGGENEDITKRGGLKC